MIDILKKYLYASLKHKLTAILSFTMFVILFYCLMVFIITSYTNNKRELEEYAQNSFYRKQELLKTYFSHLDYIAYSIIFSNWVQRFMTIDQISSHAEFQEYQRYATHFLTNLATVNDDISFVLISGSAMVWSNNTLRYNLRYDIKKQFWFDELMEERKYIEYGKSELFSGLGDVWSITLYYPVISYFNFSLLGYLAINITADKLAFLTSEISENWEENVIIYNRENTAVISSLSGYQKNERGRTKFSRLFLDNQLIVEIGVRNKVNLLSYLGSLTLVFLLLIPSVILFIMIITSFSRYLTVPIIRCKNAMLAIRQEQFGLTLDNHYHDEIGELICGFNDMSAELATLIKQNEEINTQRREAEIEILQQKVNPHFLYNTLEIINALILRGQDKDAILVCEMLGSMYHYNLTNRKWVSLREESEYVKHYLAIVQYRINGLSVFWEVDEDTFDTDILKLIIQPLVENAVLHGLCSNQSSREDACLTVAIRSVGNKTEINVMDNGTGIKSGDLEIIMNTLKSIRLGIPLDNLHVGIPNVYQRLYLEYGEDMDFIIESRLNYGTKFVIIIPAKRPGT